MEVCEPQVGPWEELLLPLERRQRQLDAPREALLVEALLVALLVTLLVAPQLHALLLLLLALSLLAPLRLAPLLKPQLRAVLLLRAVSPLPLKRPWLTLCLRCARSLLAGFPQSYDGSCGACCST